MSGCRQEKWITYASSEAEAWKALLLARSLKRGLTTRPQGILLSEKVPSEMRMRLQEEFSMVHLIPSPQNGLGFRSLAKLEVLRLKQVHKSVFVDPNVLALKNPDDLFHSFGVQFVGKAKESYAAVMVKIRTLADDEQRIATEKVVEIECRGKFRADVNNDEEKAVTLPTLNACFEVDLGSPHPSPLPGSDVKLVSFVNGHPFDREFLEMLDSMEKGPLEQELLRLCVSLCPELYPVKMVREIAVPSDIPWELHNSIAIVGMSCRYPGANTIDEYWNLLESGNEGIRRVPDGRWTKENSFVRMDNLRTTEAGFLSCPIDTFDAKFWNTNAADMHYLDPQQRLSLRLVWEALEHGGIDPLALRGSLSGVFGGWWRNDYKEMLQMVGIVDQDFLRGYMGNALGPLTARISHFFELIGPAYSTESGCSTSVAGVDMACDSLRNEQCNLAIAVGANLLLHPFSPNLVEGVLAPDGRCKTFDASADGFGRAEGIGVLVLKRFSNAVADGDRIWGLIRGAAVVQEGTSKSMGTPTVDVEAKAMSLALERSGVNPDDVEFVETHGTGTPVGDPIEVAAVAKAYGSRKRRSPLVIGSVKTNVGHTESVCGIAGIQKALLSMQHEVIPKHLHVKNLNPEIDLSAIPATLPLDPIPWKRRKGGKPRIAGVNSFGITGAQAHVIVQEPPESEKLPSSSLSCKDSRPSHILTFSAKTEEALKAQVRGYKDLLYKEGGPSLQDIEYTMHTGRPHFPLRYNIVSNSKEDFVKKMDEIEVKGKAVPNATPKLCFLFTGQGSQYPGMGKALYEHSTVFKTNMDWLASILDKNHGIKVKEALWGSKAETLLKSSMYSQTGIFAVEFCLLRLWESWGLKPDAVLGHSLGEFVAAVGAGFLSPEDALALLVTRAKLIEKVGNGGMIAVGADIDKTLDLLDRAFKGEKKWLDIACDNSASQTVLSGDLKLVQQFKTFCDNNDIKTHVLDSSHANHSRMMDPILKKYEEVAMKISFKSLDGSGKGPIYISGLEGRVITEIDAKYWVRHTRERVRFLEASKTAAKEGLSLFLEIGPHPVLSAIIATNLDDIADVETTPSLRKKSEEWEVLLSSLSKMDSLGVPICWKDFHRYSGGVKVDLPGYHFEETQYWMQIKDEGTTPFHPLLGAFIPNPSEQTLFKSQVNVNRLPFLKDHALGDKIVFPCVGYLDMCMTSAYTATQCDEGTYLKPTTPLCLRNFSILTPICLSEIHPTDFQVVVDKTPEGETRSTIFTRIFLDDGSRKWVRNATASFQPTPPPIQDPSILNLTEIRERCSEPLRPFDYNDLLQFGFNFGPSLQVVKGGWRNPNISQGEGGEWCCPFTVFETQENLDRFIIHPWVCDGLLQTQIIALGLLESNVRKQLVVPVAMDNYTWWGRRVTSPRGFIYIRHTGGTNEAHLFTEEGHLLVSMLGTEFMETTIANILSLIDSQKNPYPALAEITWREKLGSEERRIRDEERLGLDLQQFTPDSKQYNELSTDETAFYSKLDKLCGFYMLKALKELGLEKKAVFSWPQIVEELKIVNYLDKFFRHILLELEEDGWVKRSGENTFKISKKWPETNEISGNIEALTISIKNRGVGVVDLDCLEPLASSLSGILRGEVSALNILFPEGASSSTTSKGPAELFYTESLFAQKRFALNKVEAQILDVLSKMGGSKTVVRILEVGAGVGSATEKFIENMTQSGVTHFEYTYTDISPTFLSKGEKLFQESGISSKFAVLNIENSPLSQGLPPSHYDIIIGSWVLHATKDLKETLGNLRTLLRDGGLLLIQELPKPTRWNNLIFGGLEGFWRFTDTDLRPYHCELSCSGWREVLNSCGYQDVISLESCGGSNSMIVAKKVMESADRVKNISLDKTWIIFGDKECPYTKELLLLMERETLGTLLIQRSEILSKAPLEMEEVLKKKLSVENDNIQGVCYLWGLDPDNLLSTRGICEPFLYICKALTLRRDLRLVTFTRGNVAAGPGDFAQAPPTASPLIGMTGVLANENTDISCKLVDLDISRRPGDIRTCIRESFPELFIQDVDFLVAYRNRQRCTQRLKPYKVKNSPLVIPRTPRYRLILPQSHLISDLTFTPCEPEPIPEGEVEIEVKAYALNFLDVLMVTKPDPVFEKYNYLGVDIAGVVSKVGPNADRKVGQRVVLIRRKGVAMPSHLVAPDYRTLIIPDDITFEEASTIPMGLLTAATCLMEVAKAKPGDIMLVHTASGGVGLLAIQLARRLGLEIVVTAGNERKRNYLRGLGLKYVFNSRTTEYETEVRKALGGKGVTIVLNSLTQPGFKEATLNLCDPKARFIEMSKMNIWSKEEVAALRPDVFYEVVDVSQLSEEKITEISEIIQEQLLEGVDSRVQCLPYVLFEAAEIRDALEYMEKVKHIGKIVLKMPATKKNGEPVFQMFNPDSTYLVTGGLGGIGLEVAKWMGSQGARNFLLLGRSAPSSEALAKIESLKALATETRVEIAQCDVGDYAAMRDLLLNKMEKLGLPGLRGVMHCAGLLNDAAFENQSWEKYESTYRAKVDGAWNLHKLSLELPFHLEHFVVFSSLAANLGAMAQSNYVSANQFLDSLVYYRHSLGLPGNTINWGQWGQVGLVANVAVAMNKPMTIHQGIAGLEHALKSHRVQVVAHEADFPALKQILPSTRGLLADIEEDSSSGQNEIDGDEFWREYDAAGGREERYDVVRKFLKRLIRMMLKMDKNEEIEDDVAFQDMGMDSLMMVEMKNGLQASVGKRVKISINAVKDCKTVAQLTDRLVELISGKEELPAPTSEELLGLVTRDSLLGDEIKVADNLKGTRKPLEKVGTVLLTGGTGTLGPYFLRELFKRPNIRKVYCLMQSSPMMSPEERFRRIMEKKGLISDIPVDKVECLAGDIKQKNLGLSDEDYSKISSESEAVFNLAVKVVFEEIYRDSEDPKSSRKTNVGGMRNILKFAVDGGKLKWVFHASTYAAATQIDEFGHLHESWPTNEEALLFPNSAYSISKLICDRLAEQAIERGVPIKVFRLPQIGGDSVKGGNIQLDSFMMTRFLAYLYIGVMPEVRIHLSLMPVDVCAKLCTQFFFLKETKCDIYNLLNPHLGDEVNFPSLAAEFGVSVVAMKPEDFAEKWKTTDSKDEVIQLVKFAMSSDSELYHLRDKALPHYTSWLGGNDKVFWSRKLEKLMPKLYPSAIPKSWDVLRHDLQFAKESGIFQRFRIKENLKP